MAIYSHSQLNTYENCPFKYRLSYIERIKRETEGIEGFMGSRVHEALKKLYDDLAFNKSNSLEDLLAYYAKVWEQNWHDGIVIVRPEYCSGNYREKGGKAIADYYNRYAPFDRDRTLGTEKPVSFSLDSAGKYRMRGYIDRISRAQDGIFQIHDYKTSAHLPGQNDIDSDRQLALYQIGIQQKWPDATNVRLIWHYLVHDTEMVSYRTPADIAVLVEKTRGLIDKIEAATEFPPAESPLCDWCEYPDLCPRRKHLYSVESLPPNKYLEEPGVVLANKYAEVKCKIDELDKELKLVREGVEEYARREGVEVIQGSGCKLTVKFEEKLKFPGKGEKGRKDLEELIHEAGKWAEVSQLDTAALGRALEAGKLDLGLAERVQEFSKIEESSAIRLSRLKEEEE